MTTATFNVPLKDLLNTVQELKDLLVQDKQYFAENNLTQLEENAVKKMAVNQKLQALMDNLRENADLKDHKDNLFAGLAAYIKKHETADYSPLVSDLKEAITQCDHLLTVNRNVLTANFTHIKEILSALTQHQPDDAAIYSHAGHLEK